MAGMLTGLQVVAQLFEISFLLWNRVSFGFLFSAATGMLFGPVVAGLQGIAADLVAFMLFNKSGDVFFLGYTLSAMLSGVLYGCFFYQRPMRWWRALLAKGTVNLFINLGLGTWWVILLYDRGLWAILPGRVTKNLLMLAVEVPLLMVVDQVLQRVQKRTPI